MPDDAGGQEISPSAVGKRPHVYRVIYRVFLKTKTVHVLHIRHGAMDEFIPEELGRAL
jgi:plasmid stabilization system protein ParE